MPMLRLKHDLEPGRAIFGELIEPCGSDTLVRSLDSTPVHKNVGTAAPGCPAEQSSAIDQVVVTYFAKPHSYTTDDIIEISAHGSPVVLHHIVELALERGARLAEPVALPMRAFLNGRIALPQAHPVRNLIDSQTLY